MTMIELSKLRSGIEGFRNFKTCMCFILFYDVMGLTEDILAMAAMQSAIKGDVEALLELRNTEWENKISSAALKILGDNQFKKTSILQVASDLVKLQGYLLSEAPKL